MTQRFVIALVLVALAVLGVSGEQIRIRKAPGGGGGGALLSIPGDLTNTGAFTPGGSGTDSEAGFGDAAYRASSDSLFMLHGPGGQRLTEYSIPTLY
ncbi:MAG: hypothetical protein M3R04_10370, partial [bacterium]|nr:hypothetical protein [bacterium]